MLLKFINYINKSNLKLLKRHDIFLVPNKSRTISCQFKNLCGIRTETNKTFGQINVLQRFQSTMQNKNTNNVDKQTKISENQTEGTVSLRQKLQKAIAEYGTTVLVFHVSISLLSLGVCYLFVSSGIDVSQLIAKIGIDESSSLKDVSTNAGTFAIAYAVHKVFAPLRILITLSAAPFIVKYLRKIGFLKVK